MNAPSSVAMLNGLFADIKLANNGYLVLDYMRPADRVFAHECAKNGDVVITNGTVHMPATKPEFFKTPYPVRALKLLQDGPDFEDAILQRQAQAGVYD